MTDLSRLNDPLVEDRLSALRSVAAARVKPVPGKAAAGTVQREVNCHVHTFYSFSP
jgi:hypothetical protein